MRVIPCRSGTVPTEYGQPGTTIAMRDGDLIIVDVDGVFVQVDSLTAAARAANARVLLLADYQHDTREPDVEQQLRHIEAHAQPTRRRRPKP